jgi:hypothetical protein
MPKLSDTDGIALIANQSALGQVAVWATELLAERDRLRKTIRDNALALVRLMDRYAPMVGNIRPGFVEDLVGIEIALEKALRKEEKP